jgi:carboxypeptidase family protein/TonB-dependent receptor-like protein
MSRSRLSVLIISSLVVCAALLAVAPSAKAQTGTISGTVTDSSGAVVAGAQVTIRDMQTGISRETTTNSQGFYEFLTVKPSKYELTVEVKGFEKAVKRDISVVVGLESHLDVILTPGSVNETIEIKAEVPLIEPEKTNLSYSVDTQQIQNLPLQGRQFLDLAQLTPGVTAQAPGTQAGGINVSGMRSQSNNFTLDGVSINDPQVNGPLNQFRIADAVQEFNVNTSIADTDLGRSSGAQVAVITKSGGNTFHGSAFYYGRNEALDANDWFLNHSGKSKNMLRRHQYGGTMGGPLVKDRTFWFFNFEGFRQKNPQPGLSTVPTDAARATVTDPVSLKLLQFIPRANILGAAPGTTNWAGTFDQFNNNDTYLGRVDHNLTRNNRLSGHYAIVHGTNLQLQQQSAPFHGSITNVPASHSAVIDETFTHNRWLNVARIGFTRNLTKFGPQDVALNPASIFTDALGNPLPGFVDTSKSPRNGGLPRITITSSSAVPLSNIGLGAGTNMPQGRTTDTYQLIDNLTWIKNSHTLSFGGEGRREETFRFLNGNFRGAISFADWAHFAGTTGPGGVVAQPRTGSLRAGGPDETFRTWTRNAYYMYIQDSWKMKSNLTFNYGIRYERPGSLVEKGDSGSNFVPGVGLMKLNSNLRIDIDPTKLGQAAITLTPVSTFLPRSGQFHEANMDFAPFAGVAWSPKILPAIFGNGKTVIRTGFRLGYDDVFANIPVNMGLNIGQKSAPFLLTTTLPPGTYTWATALNQNRFLFQADPTVPGGSQGIVGFNAWDTTGRTAYAMNYGLQIERQIGNAYAVEASYVGSLGRRLGVFVDPNEPFITGGPTTVLVSGKPTAVPYLRTFPFQQYAGIGLGTFGSNSNYNGAVFSIRKKPSHGLELQASYTFAKSMDDNSAFFGSTGEAGVYADSRNRQAEYGPSAFDIRHQVVVSYLYQMPVGRGRAFLHDTNRLLDYVVGGWDIGGITNLHSGFPFTIFANTSTDFSGFNQFVDRPLAGNTPLPINYSNPDRVFPTTPCQVVQVGPCYFAIPGAGNIGNIGRNAYYGPRYVDFDFSLQKNFAITESKRFQFRAEFFNLFNHANFDLPSSSLQLTQNSKTGIIKAASSAGTITSDNNANPRLMQLGLRFDF